jgi:hypothetical protein
LHASIAAVLLVCGVARPAHADEPPKLSWFETTRYEGRDVWELGVLGGAGGPDVKAGDRYDATMNTGPAGAVEAAWRADGSWLEFASGLRVAWTRSSGIQKVDGAEGASDLPRSLDTLTFSTPVRVLIGKVWLDNGSYWKSPFRGMFGAAPTLVLRQLDTGGGKITSARLGGCWMVGFALRTPRSRAVDDVFVEGDQCSATSAGGVRLDQTLFYLGYHAGWHVRFRK